MSNPIPRSILHIEGDPTSWGLGVVGPAATGLTAAAPGYALAPPDDEIPALITKLIDAMSGPGKRVSVQISTVGSGVVVLNGAQLPFAVVAPAG